MSILLLFLLLAIFHGVQPKGAEEFDCVDIHKQPAFDHVLLKNHKIQMSPSSMPKLKRNAESSFGKYSTNGAQMKGCPPGKVPIHKIKVNYDLNELRSFAKLHLGINNNNQPLTTEFPGRHFAAMYTEPSDYIFGARATISVYNPPVKMNQISMSQIWIESGLPAQRNSIQVGWAVHPRIYGDNRTRVTAFWTADGSRKTGCYNTMCKGFVQVHPKYYLGQYYDHISVIGGDQYITQPLIYQDVKTGNYWVVFDGTVAMGYWPKELFTSFKIGISFFQYGGWTFNSPDGISPPMGSGLFPDNHYNRSSYFSQIEFMGDPNNFFKAKGLKEIVDTPKCYGLKFWGDQGGQLKETFTFGGPGGSCGI